MIVLPQIHGLLRPHVSSSGGAELVPTIKYAELGSTQSTTSTAYSSLLTFTVTTSSVSDCLNIVLSGCGNASTNTPSFQITVDGVSVGETCSTVRDNFSSWTVSRVSSVTGLSAGTHTVVLNWKSANGNSVSITPSNGVDHCVLVCRLATGTAYATLGVNATSTATTPTDSLISTTYTSTQASSALYIRFSAAGVSNSAVTTEFQVLVDGNAAVACADVAGNSGYAFNAGAVVVVPVSSGAHTVAVKWAGGSGSGSTITVSDPRQHAALLVDEVNTGSPRSSRCTNDITQGNDAASCSIATPASGASDLLIEATASPYEAGNAACQVSLLLDGATAQQSRSGAEIIAGTEGLFMLHIATSLSAASHSVTLHVVGGFLDCATNPTFAHANLVVWPVTVQP